MSDWFKKSIVYQIYVQSFKDTNNDGIGDLPGIIESLDYIKDLGANTIWLTPIFKSPMVDNGYDISDYDQINPIYGTMDDFDHLITLAHKKGLKILLDGVYNHTSDEHRWFIESKKSKDNPYCDFYIWRDPKEGSLPSNAGSVFGGSAWEYVPARKQYYFHLFAKKQPDINWDNPKVRQAIYKSMEFWLDKGVDGFRFDSISFISKDQRFKKVLKTNSQGFGVNYIGTANGPHIHEYLQEMNREVLSHYDTLTVGETPRTDVKKANLYVDPARKELNMIFCFETMHVDDGENGNISDVRFKMSDLRSIFNEWETGVSWNALYLDNHDQPRLVSRFGDDKKFRVQSAKMLAMMMVLQKGTPFIFQGDELGMTNVDFNTIDDFKDLDATNKYQTLLNVGIDEKRALELVRRNSRSNGRTPMQWNDSKYAGFSDHAPWISVNKNYHDINVQKALTDEDSVLNFYKQLLRLKLNNEIAINGDFRLVSKDDSAVFSYLRELDDKKILVICSFTPDKIKYNRPADLDYSNQQLLLSNYKDADKKLPEIAFLRPYEARSYLLN